MGKMAKKKFKSGKISHFAKAKASQNGQKGLFLSFKKNIQKKLYNDDKSRKMPEMRLLSAGDGHSRFLRLCACS